MRGGRMKVICILALAGLAVVICSCCLIMLVVGL